MSNEIYCMSMKDFDTLLPLASSKVYVYIYIYD